MHTHILVKLRARLADKGSVEIRNRKYRDIRDDQRGFTLIELLVVIAIMGILFGIATSTWQGVTESRRVDSAANQLTSDMRLLNARASNQLAEWRLVFKPDGGPVTGCSGADHCLVKVTDADTEDIPRNFPERTGVSSTNISTDSDTGGMILDGITGSFLGPSSVGDTVTIRFYADGSAEAEAGGEPRITVGPDDGSPDPTHDMLLAEQTSRVKID